MRLFRRQRFENDMDAELRFHIDAYVDDLVRSGVKRSEAERRARIEFGAVEATKDDCRQAWGLQWIDELRADVRYAFRMFRNHPGFTSTAVVSLALGIGANTAIFGLLDAVMLRILPVHDPERLVFVQNVGTQGPSGGPPYPCFELLRNQAQSFEAMAAFSASGMEMIIDGNREQLRGIWVSGNFYDLLGVRPLWGRTLSAADDSPVAVISDAYWRQRFGGDPAIVGRAFPMFGRSVTIVGVMPAEAMSLEPGRPVDIAAPIMFSNPATLRDRSSWWLDVVARLKPGVASGQARAEADTLFQAYMATLPTQPAIRKLSFDRIELAPAARGTDGLRNQFSTPLMAMMILAGLVLFASCANVASMMLARAAARQKEFAVRLAIGAGRLRLIRRTLTESMVLVGAASALGILIAIQAQQVLAAFFAEGNNMILLDLSINGRLLLFTLTVSALTGLAFGLLPAFRAAAADRGSRSVTGNRGTLRLGRALVILQVALSMVLLSGATLFIRSLRQLESVDLGFIREGTLTMEIAPERQLNGTPEWLGLQSEILERVGRMPGVAGVSWSTMSPMSGRDRGVLLDVPGTPSDKRIHVISVSPEYFETFGVSILQGRRFTARDNGTAPKVAILNEAAARFYFGTASPIGERVKFEIPRNLPAYEIAGVVKDAKHRSLREQPTRFIYFPIPQSIDHINRLALAIRVSGDPMTLAAPVTREIRSVRSSLLITNVSSIEKQVQLSLLNERLVSTLSMAFGGLALALSCIGLYGILAYGVARRTNEFGIRMALGATGSGMVWLILREALALAVCGIVLGVPAVMVLGRMAKALLYGVEPVEFPTLIWAVLPLLVFAAIAGIIPARRAGRLDPMAALRSD
ncbi:MAG: ADOP family duplicated permease [Bryobacteraceae bacterium]